MTVRAVSFDADDTLWDFRAGMLRSLTAVLENLKQKVSSPIAQDLTVDHLIEIRDQVAQEMAEPGVRPTKTFLTDVRRAAFVRTLEWLHVDFEPELRSFYETCGFRHTESGLMRLHGDKRGPEGRKG